MGRYFLLSLLLTIGFPLVVSGFESNTFDAGLLRYAVIDNGRNEVAVAGFLGDKNYDVRLSVEVPSSVTSAGVTYTVTAIGERAFEECRSITELTLPETITEIGDYAFSFCVEMRKMHIPASVAKIGYSLFSDCWQLREVNLPEWLTEIPKGTFFGCYNLGRIHIPESVRVIGEGSFSGCRSLSDLNLPEGLVEICSSAFTRCGFVNLSLPESLVYIREFAFSSCELLKSVSLPASLNRIDDEAFECCRSLTEINSWAVEPPALKGYEVAGVTFGVWTDVPKDAVVYVPPGCVEAYRNANGWDYFTDFRPFEGSGIESIDAEAAGWLAEYFLPSGIRVDGSSLRPGLYIKRMAGKVCKVVVR